MRDKALQLRPLPMGPRAPYWRERGREPVSGGLDRKQFSAALPPHFGKESSMKSLFRGAFFRGVSASALAISLAACTATPQPLDRPGDVPVAFTGPMSKSAPVWPQADWWSKFGAPPKGYSHHGRPDRFRCPPR